MDISIVVLAIATICVVAFIVAFSHEKIINKIVGGVIGLASLCFCMWLVNEWSEATHYESLQFELVEKIPFEWNKAHQSYFFHHDGQWKASEAYVDHFDHSKVKTNPEYDSCYVYQISLPKIMGHFDTRWWMEDYEYRQSEDILLLSREKRKIEMK